MQATAPRPVALLLALALTSSSAGCMLRVERRQVTHPVKVTTSPQRAWIWTQDAEGKQHVGRAPLTLKPRYEVRRQRFRRWNWLTTALFAGATAGGIAMIAADDSSEVTSSGQMVGGIVLTTLAGIVTLTSLMANVSGEIIDGRDLTTSKELMIGASLPGYSDGWAKLKLPGGPKKVHVALAPGGGADASSAKGGVLGVLGPAPRTGAALRGPIVAVFQIHDAGRRFDRDTLEQLTEYLATQLAAEAGYRIVPRQQLRARLAEQRKESYRVCRDESCQIEIGKTLAAQKSLSTRLLRVGDKCAITAVLYDLKSETAAAAATADTGCGTDALMGGIRTVVQKLGGPR